MEERTLDAALNNEYSELSGIITGRVHIDVLVEDELDVPFWYDVLHSEYPDLDFSVTPYQYNTDGDVDSGKGKQHILEEANKCKFGKYYIGCVDSDYDYLLKEKSHHWQSMMSPRIVQTYTYSIENLMCHPSTLKEVCSKCVKEIPTDDFEHFMDKLSEILYPLLRWSVYMEDIHCHDFTVKSWNMILASSFSGSLDWLLEDTRKRVDDTIKNLEANHPSATTALERCEKKYLEANGVKPGNCYQYVRGHDMYKFIVKNVMKPVCQQLKIHHYQELRNVGGDIQNLTNHYKRMLLPIEEQMSINYEYKKYSPYYAKIRDDVRVALS